MLTKCFYPHIHWCRVRVSRRGKDATLCPTSSQNGSHRTYTHEVTDGTGQTEPLPRLSLHRSVATLNDTCGIQISKKSGHVDRAGWCALVRYRPPFSTHLDSCERAKVKNSLVLRKCCVEIHGLNTNQLQIFIYYRRPKLIGREFEAKKQGRTIF